MKELEFFAQLDALPPDAKTFWDRESSASFFLSRWWFDTILSAGLNPGDEPTLGLLRGDDGRVCGILPARIIRRRAGPLSWSELHGLTGIYSCYFRPLAELAADAVRLGALLAERMQRLGIVHFDSLDAQWPLLADLERGLARSGFRVARYAHFANWSENLGGRSFDAYIAARDGALREIIRRKGRRLEREGRIRYQIVSTDAELDQGIAIFDAVYARSWKVAEPYPAFQSALMRNACRENVLRLGVCRIDGAPVAVQLWIVWRGRATVLKLAHDEFAKSYSGGSLLTAWMIERLIADDAITAIDFGRGDDAYKRLWTTQRDQRVGLIAAHPRSAAGLTLYLRQRAEGSRLIRWLRRRR